ncbi:DUF1987 domain-containing protein [Crocinitomix algicola]|uniref:DUF1987 domain-containing protein n=1 Tax=Crocinitomix algicola TaxID=1740263 RepID=UPI000829C148|nr:DUF1987 domain-containing protein [Crocinitomix algicola]
MENLVLNASEKTPYCNLECNGNFKFEGVSMPEDAATFYFKIIDWISDYYRTPSENTLITVNFAYLNSTSSSMILKIFHSLNRLQDSGKTCIKCKWYYEPEDIDMKEYIEQVSDCAKNIEFDVCPLELAED